MTHSVPYYVGDIYPSLPLLDEEFDELESDTAPTRSHHGE